MESIALPVWPRLDFDARRFLRPDVASPIGGGGGGAAATGSVVMSTSVSVSTESSRDVALSKDSSSSSSSSSSSPGVALFLDLPRAAPRGGPEGVVGGGKSVGAGEADRRELRLGVALLVDI